MLSPLVTRTSPHVFTATPTGEESCVMKGEAFPANELRMGDGGAVLRNTVPPGWSTISMFPGMSNSIPSPALLNCGIILTGAGQEFVAAQPIGSDAIPG